ncbi:MAG: Glutamate racemase [Pelotomaculum sp. PtaB.Bin104]|nr:MAG: Glutamate racemase [Pelotomaculum sp. PtaB.Bin104]
MNNSGAIGLFDSGVGGLTVSRVVNRLLPAEAIIYYGDTAHVPYGQRSAEELLGFADKIVSFLAGQEVKYIIFACNTNSALSLPVLSSRYPLPMIGLIKPGVAEALQTTRNGKIGVIATEATVRSGAYEKEIKIHDKSIEVFSRAAPLLVPLVEAGETDTPAVARAVRQYLSPLGQAGIDTLILGCTHYPFLAGLISEEMGPDVRLIDPAVSTVRGAAKEISRLGLLASGEASPVHRFYVSGEPHTFREQAQRFLGRDVGRVIRADL